MLKQTAIDAFGSVTELAAACGVSPSAVSQWGDPLPRHAEDKVLAAVLRAGRLPTPDMLRGSASEPTRVA